MADYSDHPVSITEARANREENSALWTPRDALISMLRDIDNGIINPDALVAICRTKDEDGAYRTTFVNATPDVHVAMGLLTRGHFRLMEA
jgi:hypothetical protein